MKGDAKILLGVVATGAAFAGILLWGTWRAKPTPPAPPAPPLEPTGPFPDLRAGDLIMVDAAAARLGPPPLDTAGVVSMVVDQILTDRFVVSAAVFDPRFPLMHNSQTIPRSAIVRVLARAPTVFT